MVPALCLVLLGLAACGGGSGKASGTAGASAAASGADSTSTTTADQASLKAYGDCLSQHGVKVPANFGQGGPPNRGSGSTTTPGQTPASGETTTTDAAGGGRGQGGGLGALRNDPNFAAAQQACQSLRPTGRGPGGGGANAGAYQAYQSCMKDNGITLPSRGPGGFNQGGSSTTPPSTPTSPPSTIDRNSPAFQAANQKCQALLPSGQNGGQSQPGNTGSLPTTTTTTAS